MINTLKAVAISLGLIMPLSAMAQDHKNLDFYIGFGPTGSYDLYGRLLAKHIGKYLPGNPTVTVKSMPGANGLTLANYLYKVAPQDGTAIGTIARGAATDPLLGTQGANFDSTKFNWIGSANDEVGVCMIFKSTGVSTLEEAKKTEVILGGTTAGGDDAQFPYFINKIIGTKFKLVIGYPGNSDVNLAMERGEVHGRCGASWSRVPVDTPLWITENRLNVLVQLANKKDPALPNVPLIAEFAKTDMEKGVFKLVFARQTMGRPFLAPPNVPANKVNELRRAFDAAMKDPELLAEAKKLKLDIDPVSGEAVQQLVAEAYAMPKEIINYAAEIMKEAAK